MFRLKNDARFWDRIARKYAADRIADMAGYERTLARTRDYLKGDETAFEFGCGTGTTALRLAPSLGRIVATDISGGMIAIAREKAAAQSCANVEFEVATADAAPWPDGSFDLALGFNVLHLVAAREAALQGLHRLLKPGGLLITKTPCLKEMNPAVRIAIPVMQLFGKAPYVALLSAQELEREMEAAGFEIIERERHGAARTRDRSWWRGNGDDASLVTGSPGESGRDQLRTRCVCSVAGSERVECRRRPRSRFGVRTARGRARAKTRLELSGRAGRSSSVQNARTGQLTITVVTLESVLTRSLPMTPTITAFESSPDGGKGLARDMRVRWALEEVGQPYEVRLVSFREMKEPAHRALHPFGQIPTYEEGDLVLFESGAIVFHIAERHAGLLPADANARARAITWMFAALNTVEPPIVEREQAPYVERDEVWYEERLTFLDDRIRARLDDLSNRLGDADWLDGQFSAGDLMMVMVLRRLDGTRILEEYPNLSAYVARGEARPAYRRAFDAQLRVFTAASAG